MALGVSQYFVSDEITQIQIMPQQLLSKDVAIIWSPPWMELWGDNHLAPVNSFLISTLFL